MPDRRRPQGRWSGCAWTLRRSRGGEVPCYLQLGPEAAANPQMAIQQLMQAGWPVKCWQPRPPAGGGGWNGGGQGGYQGGGRGWGRRY